MRWVFVLAVVLLVVLQAAPAPAQPVVGSCTTSQIKFKAADNQVFIGSGWAIVPDMGFTFTMSQRGCLKVEFSAMVLTNSGFGVNIRAVLDNAVSGAPFEVIFSGNQPADVPTPWNSHAFNFGFSDVTAGSHSVQIEASSTSGSSIMGSRSIFVHYP